MGLNPKMGPGFVSAYIDDILVYSSTMEEHLHCVLYHLEGVGLKLKATRCKFAQKEVEFLGHIITPNGLRSNPKLVGAVREYSTPQSVQEVRKFLDLASYYRRFIPQFAKVAQPLHQLTGKGNQFH